MVNRESTSGEKPKNTPSPRAVRQLKCGRGASKQEAGRAGMTRVLIRIGRDGRRGDSLRRNTTRVNSKRSPGTCQPEFMSMAVFCFHRLPGQMAAEGRLK